MVTNYFLARQIGGAKPKSGLQLYQPLLLPETATAVTTVMLSLGLETPSLEIARQWPCTSAVITAAVAFTILYQGRSDGGGYRYLYPPKSAQVNFLWGKNDVRTAIQQFYTPQNKFLAAPLYCTRNRHN